MATKDTGTVNIHGKEYKTVAKRVEEFRNSEIHGNFGLQTEIVSINESIVVMKATVLDTEGRAIATGHAEEVRTASMINKTSALENCETSAIGRALASFGLAGTEFASANEVQQAMANQAQPEVVKAYQSPRKTTASLADELTAKKKELLDAVKAKGMDNDEFTELKLKTIGVTIPTTIADVQEVLDALSK